MNKRLDISLKTAQDRENFLLSIVSSLMLGEVNRGEVVKHLRKQLLNMNQAEFAKLAKVSRRTLTEIENNSQGLNEDSINRVFAIFGLKLGLVPISQNHAKTIASTKN